MASPKGTIIVTGANGGLGSAIIRKIVAKPELATLYGVYTVRDARAATSLEPILQATNSHHNLVLSLELSRLSSVREAAATINAKVNTGEIPPIRALILNAAQRETQGQTWTESGLDLTFAGNYLGHWLLTLLLLPSIDRELGRVVVVGGWAHE